MKSTDLSGKRFGRLTVIERGQKAYYGKSSWKCKCDCGNEITVVRCSLTANKGTKSCGCLAKEKQSESSKRLAVNLVGQKFGRLTVIERNDKERKTTSAHWLCRCDCGKEKTISASNLVRKNKPTQSCGCYSRELASERGHKLNTKPQGEASFNALFYHYKYNASKRNLVFELEQEYFKSLTQKPCFYCNELPSNKQINRNGCGDFVYNGIDRQNNKIGYIKSNCVSCCDNCNRSKDIRTVDEFKNWIKRVYNTLLET